MPKYLKDYMPNIQSYNDSLSEISVFRVQMHQDFPCVDITLASEETIIFKDYEWILKEFQTLLKANVRLFVQAKKEIIDLGDIQKYLQQYCQFNEEVSYLLRSSLTYDLPQNQIHLIFVEEQDASRALEKLPELRQGFQLFGYPSLGFSTEVKNDRNTQVNTVTVKEAEEEPAVKKPKQKYRSQDKKYESYTSIQLADVKTPLERVMFEGTIFKKEDFETKSTKTIIQTLSIFDGTDAIYVKRFEGKRCTREELNEAEEGKRICVYGNIVQDNYVHDLVCEAEKVIISKPEPIVDPAEEKRIEFHSHSNLSEMDGVCKPEEIVQYAWNLGHEGLVLTDHADVQGFVKAFNTAEGLKKSNPSRSFKLGLGCELNLADDQLTVVRNGTNELLDDVSYVCFDLETTGLSCYYDHIIEFGAVRMKNQTVLDHIQMFIKPPVPIPAAITKKTNITNEIVQNAKPIEEAIDEILAWIGNDVLVAHNATFDYYFLNEELRRMNRPPLTNTVIDTLDLARVILKERRVYRLGNIARNYRISYDEEVAHRADYDAETLSGVFLCLLRDAIRMGASTIFDLQDKIQDSDSYKKVRRSHTTVIVKNKEGLKSLYKLITESNTKTLAILGKASDKDGSEIPSEPRVLRSSLEKVRKDFLIGTSCQNNEIFELACNGDDARLKDAMKWYDYVEIQPPGHYEILVALGNIPSMDRVKEVLKRIIACAKELNIPVIADSDAHYCSKDEKILREVYIMNQGVGGAVHPLFIRDDAIRLRTKSPDQHIYLTEEMLDAFSWLEDEQLVYEIVIENPKKLFSLIEDNIRPVPAGTYPPRIEGSDENLKEVCYENARAKYEFEGQLPKQVAERLEKELYAIIGAGYAVNYYISHLLVKKSNSDGYMVGSRGSVGSSFTATMAGITEVNPLQPHYLCPSCHYSEWIDDVKIKSGYDLPYKKCPHCGQMMHGEGHNIPFETFLGFEGNKVPDIDLNFSGEYQAKAHAFTKEIFGDEHVFRAGTIGTVKEKTAFGYVSGYCEKMFINDMKRPMREYLAQKCQGVKRTTGQHAGGIIVIPDEFEAEDFTPVQYPANELNSDWKTTHFDFHDIHDNVLKFDILGHVDPTAMRLLSNISKMDPHDIPLNDPEAISLFYSDQALKADPRIYHAETGALGLPEFGTRITRNILEETRPKQFSDLVIISGLSHGTDVWAGNAQKLIASGSKLDEIIGCRDDIMVDLINYGLPAKEAFDIMEQVRKGNVAKGKCDKWPEYTKLMLEHNVPVWYIDSCEKIKYMFPKAHAVAYVIMAVRIAWYKVHEPHNFYAQFFSYRCDAYDIETMTKGIESVRLKMNDIQTRINDRNSANPVSNKERALLDTFEVSEEMFARGYRFGNIDLYRSQATEFLVDPEDSRVIIPPFSVIDGLGANVAKSLVEERKNGDFLSKEDILKRTQLSQTLLRRLEIMGCLDGLQESNQISLF